MDKNIDFKALAAELAALERQGKGKGEDLLIARVLHNMSPSRWKEFCKAYPASKWGAVPVSSLNLSHMADEEKDAGFLWGDELKYAIMAEKFTEQVERELLRMARIGGELSILSCAIPPAAKQCSLHTALEELLIKILKNTLEPCDSLATDGEGHPLVLLPGTGPIRSRHLCEQLQNQYANESKKLYPDVFVSMGVVSIAQGEKRSAEDLVARVASALQKAQTEASHLHQIGPETLDERSTLVHSDEKRFLFFGGAY
ncbi:MAG: hypothetical protein IJS54_04380 [Desulfovibrio sp.]|nr:hypothetical protein [Desulfovibrio sp.]